MRWNATRANVRREGKRRDDDGMGRMGVVERMVCVLSVLFSIDFCGGGEMGNVRGS